MSTASRLAARIRATILRSAARLEWTLLFPSAAAFAWFYGQDAVAMLFIFGLPIVLALDGRLMRPRGTGPSTRPAAGEPFGRAAIVQVVDDVLKDCARRDRTTALLRVEIDDLEIGDGGWGGGTGEATMDRLVPRISSTLRGQDIITRLGEDGFVIILAPTRHADLDTLMNIVDRLQAAIAEPISLNGRSFRVHSCVGICSEAMAPERSGAAMLAATDCALRIARRQGADAVRAFNPDIRMQVETDHRLSTQIEDALESGQIRPWFQPQVDARTGAIVGFEALARWHHPELGVLSPDRFLCTIASAGRGAELGECILRAGLKALIAWDAAGLSVPCLGINVSLDELMDPRLAERIAWQVDRYDIAPERIAIEILETVTLRDHDAIIMRNLQTLRKAGFRLDLDDFGTGAASIAHIAQFGVHRIKIDRSFVHGIENDPARRDVVSAILGLAQRLRIATLAEGVETPAEQAVLAEMGCPHLQGFGIAKPMPFEETVRWAQNRRSVKQPKSLSEMEPRGTA